MVFFFVRHGESEANVLEVFSNRGWKHPLTAKGRLQVEQLAGELQHRGVVTIYTSPLRRAVESAELISKKLMAPCEIEPALVEYDVGIFENRGYAEGRPAVDALERQWTEGDRAARLPDGESWDDIHARLLRFVTRAIERFNGRNNASAVFVGHGGTFCQALPALVGNVAPTFAVERGMGYAAVVEVELREKSLHCVRWNSEWLLPQVRD